MSTEDKGRPGRGQMENPAWPQRVPNLHKLECTSAPIWGKVPSPGPESHHVKPGAKKARQERRWGMQAEPDPLWERGEEPGINSGR